MKCTDSIVCTIIEMHRFSGSRKKIGPLQWDLSIAEHLEPGEEYRQVQTRAYIPTHGSTTPQPQLHYMPLLELVARIF